MQSGEIKFVDLNRGSGGFGFTLSSQGPCILSSVVAGGPADRKGLKPGDQVFEVNGRVVESAPHEVVVKAIARSAGGVVRLGVRTPVENATDNHHPNASESPDEVAFSKNILNRVDKVVEELKSGQLFMDSSPALRQSFSNGKLITEEEIVSDEDLKASFSESIRSESSSQSRSTARSGRRSSDGDVHSALSTPKLSRVLYPVLTPVNPSVNSADVKPEIRCVVGYLGSIELPASSSLQTASSNAIRSSVRRLRAQQKVHVHFVMEVSFVGVRLLDSKKRTIVTYPIKSLAFTGLCSDDKRVFGIVTRKNTETRVSQPVRWQNVNIGGEESQSTINCSCHVFSVDPDLFPHEVHDSIAEKFALKCSRSDDGSGCVEFPVSCSPILRVITGLFKERSGSESGGTSSDGEGRSGRRKSRSESDARRHSADVMDVDQIDIQLHPVQGENGNSDFLLENQPPTTRDVYSECVRNSNRLDKDKKGSDRNDSGLGSDSYQINGNERNTSLHQVNGGMLPAPTVNVSYHCRDSSVDSEMSVGSGAVFGAEHGVTHSTGDISGPGLTSASLKVLKEVSVQFSQSGNESTLFI